MREELNTLLEHDFGSDDTAGTDSTALPDDGAGGHRRGRMDLGHA
jgi:hypothetical protein